MPVGLSPTDAAQVNVSTGSICREFVNTRDNVKSQADWLLGQDLTAAPYLMAAEDQVAIKSAISTLNTALQGVDMTFINALLGLPV